MSIPVIKASGKIEGFDPEKLVSSLVRSGAPEDIARDIAEKISEQIPRSVHTRHIFRLAKKLLRQYNRSTGMRYSLKKAIYALGPTGYPFEKFVGRILVAHGYSVEVNRVMKGYCVSHEVDVLAEKGSRRCMIECKHHSKGDKPTDIKVALYVHSRFEDIKKGFRVHEQGNSHIHEGWLVTNTRCSADAIKYAECTGLRVVSWGYPETRSLEAMIEGKRLYPVTVLPSARGKTLEALTGHDIILADEVSGMNLQMLMERSGLDRATASVIKKQAGELSIGLG
ncbi:MAG: ATPase [Nitrospirales bacterium]|nr:ATPase [Nitrospirales bacterium]